MQRNKFTNTWNKSPDQKRQVLSPQHIVLEEITKPIKAFFNPGILQICGCQLPKFSTRAVIWEFWELLKSIKLKYFPAEKIVI